MKRLALTVLVLAACSSSDKPTQPTAPWFEGQWDAATVDGVAMPATVGGTTYRTFRLTARNAGTSVFTVQQQSPQFTTSCASTVTLAVVNGGLKTDRFDNANPCGTPWFDHLFLPSVDKMQTQWEGHTVVLTKTAP